MRRLDVSSEAELEVFAAVLRYERERPGLGTWFEADVNDDLVTVLAVLHLHQDPDTWKRGR